MAQGRSEVDIIGADGARPASSFNPLPVQPGASDYETVAASASDQVIGATGAVGDFLAGLLIVPATTSPGAVSIKDGSGTGITVFAGGASSVPSLAPVFVPLNMKSVDGAWKVTTGANVSVIAVGKFTLTLAALTLAASTIEEGSAEDTVVGAIQAASAGSTVSLFDNAGGRFKITGSNIVAAAVATEFDTAASRTIALLETHAKAANSPRYTERTITVEQMLVALTLSAAVVEDAAAEDTVVGAIVGAKSGSTLTLTDDASGHFKLVGSNIVTTATAVDIADVSYDIEVTETKVAAGNSPKVTPLTITVTA